MTITAASIHGDELRLKITNVMEAAKFVYDFKAGDYTLAKEKKKRPKTMNDYCWVLIYKIAGKIHEDPTVVYRRYIRDVGCKTVVTCVEKKDLETEVNGFLAGHIGRLVDIGESKIEGCVTLHKKYGSSSFDTKEMSAFIDAIIQDCIALDIEVRPQEEIDSLLDQWGGGHG